MVFGWGSPRKADAGISQEEATALFARMASGKSCTPSEGSETSKDSKAPSSDAGSSLTSPASVNQSNMMPNPNQKRAAQQRCERASSNLAQLCPRRHPQTHLANLFLFRHPLFFVYVYEERKRKTLCDDGRNPRRSIRFENVRDTINVLLPSVTAVLFKTRTPQCGHETPSSLTFPTLSSLLRALSTSPGVICRPSECLQPSLSVSATETCQSISVAQRRHGNIRVNKCFTTPS